MPWYIEKKSINPSIIKKDSWVELIGNHCLVIINIIFICLTLKLIMILDFVFIYYIEYDWWIFFV